MKQLIFLLLFPCLALAQYPGNAGQKITLGEQTTADGLVYRGLAADTTRKPSVDTMAYILLDTNTNIIWQYKKATNNAWTRVGGSISSGVTGVLPVANGGTGQTTLAAAGINTGSGTLNFLPKYTATGTTLGNSSIFDNGNVGIGTTPSTDSRFHVRSSANSTYVFRGMNSSGSDLGGWYQSPTGDAEFYLKTSAVATTVRISTNNVTYFSGGNVGIGTTSPTATLHLKAGTATASTAPLKFTSGVNLTSPLGGEMEFNGTNLFFSPSTTRHTVNHGLTGSATLDFLSTNAQNSRDMTIAVTGAADGDVVSLGVPNAAVNANTCYTAWVSAANTVTVRFNNYSSGTVDPASGLFKVFVTK